MGENISLASIQASLDAINSRLDTLESAGSHTKIAKLTHPSLDKFSIAEAIADEVFAGLNKEKACQYEPAKPCDHCSMCNSRGF